MCGRRGEKESLIRPFGLGGVERHFPCHMKLEVLRKSSMPEEMRGPSFVTLIFPSIVFRSISVARLHMFWISVLTSELTYLGIGAACQKVVHAEEFDQRSFVFALHKDFLSNALPGQN